VDSNALMERKTHTNNTYEKHTKISGSAFVDAYVNIVGKGC
jgi:hypothetical protein